jgi:hypothetical protein
MIVSIKNHVLHAIRFCLVLHLYRNGIITIPHKHALRRSIINTSIISAGHASHQLKKNEHKTNIYSFHDKHNVRASIT